MIGRDRKHDAEFGPPGTRIDGADAGPHPGGMWKPILALVAILFCAGGMCMEQPPQQQPQSPERPEPGVVTVTAAGPGTAHVLHVSPVLDAGADGLVPEALVDASLVVQTVLGRTTVHVWAEPAEGYQATFVDACAATCMPDEAPPEDVAAAMGDRPYAQACDALNP